ncbi:MAG: hypothetical protein ABI151_13535 [Chitinophagaceae bacterium]
MPLKNIKFLAAITSAAFLFSCNGGSSGQKETESTPQHGGNPAANHEQASTINLPATCYALDTGKDKIVMQIAINNNTVTGNLLYKYSGKDRNSGTIQGEMHGDTLLATYTFMSEGKESKRDVAFLKKGDEIVEGYGKVDPATGAPDLTDKSVIKFDNTFILKKTDCKTDDHGCMVLMGMTWSPLKNDCIDLQKAAIRLDPVEMTDKAKAPAYIVMSDDQVKAELYLPENDHPVMLERKGKEGNWTWQHDDLKLIPWKGYVLQKKGLAIYGGM